MSTMMSRHLAMLILEVARVKPHKRRRWKFLAHNHFGLYVRLKELWVTMPLTRFSISRLSRFGCALLIAFGLLPRHGTGTSRHVSAQAARAKKVPMEKQDREKPQLRERKSA